MGVKLFDVSIGRGFGVLKGFHSSGAYTRRYTDCEGVLAALDRKAARYICIGTCIQSYSSRANRFISNGRLIPTALYEPNCCIGYPGTQVPTLSPFRGSGMAVETVAGAVVQPCTLKPGTECSFFFLRTSTFQLLDKPWSQASSLLPPGSCF